MVMLNQALAEGIVISDTGSRLADDVYQLDAKLEFDYESEVFHALEHGVSIRISIYIQIKRERDWMWDPKVREKAIGFRLEQHPLSKRYLITNLNDGQRYQFKYREDALSYLGTIKDHFPIIVSTDENYYCMLRAEVTTEALPPVIRPIAFVSQKWQLESDWYSWPITGEESGQ